MPSPRPRAAPRCQCSGTRAGEPRCLGLQSWCWAGCWQLQPRRGKQYTSAPQLNSLLIAALHAALPLLSKFGGVITAAGQRQHLGSPPCQALPSRDFGICPSEAWQPIKGTSNPPAPLGLAPRAKSSAPPAAPAVVVDGTGAGSGFCCPCSVFLRKSFKRKKQKQKVLL